MPAISDIPINHENDSETDGEILNITVLPQTKRQLKKRRDLLTIIGAIFCILIIVVIIRILKTTGDEHYPLFPDKPNDEVGPSDGSVLLGSCFWLNLTLVPKMYAKNYIKYAPNDECLISIVNVDGNDLNSLRSLIGTFSYNLPGVENNVLIFTGFDHELVNKIYKLYSYTAVKLPLPNEHEYSDLIVKSKVSTYEMMLLLKKMNIHLRSPVVIVDNEQFVSKDFFLFARKTIKSHHQSSSAELPILLGFKGTKKLNFDFNTFKFVTPYDEEQIQMEMSTLQHYGLWIAQPFVLTPPVFNLLMDVVVLTEYFSVPASFHDTLLFLQTRGYLYSNYIGPVYTRVCNLDTVRYSIVPNDITCKFPIFPNILPFDVTFAMNAIYDPAFEHFSQHISKVTDIEKVCNLYDLGCVSYNDLIAQIPDKTHSMIEWDDFYDLKAGFNITLKNCRIFNVYSSKQFLSLMTSREYLTIIRMFESDITSLTDTFEHILNQISKSDVEKQDYIPIWLQYFGKNENLIYDIIRNNIKNSMTLIVTVEDVLELNFESFEKLAFLKSLYQPIIVSNDIVPFLFLETDVSLSPDYNLVINELTKHNVKIDSKVYPVFMCLDGKEYEGSDEFSMSVLGTYNISDLLDFKNIYLDTFLIETLLQPQNNANILQILNYGENLEESLKIFINETFLVNLVKSMKYSRVYGQYLPDKYNFVRLDIKKDETNLSCSNKIKPSPLSQDLKEEMKVVANYLKLNIPQFPDSLYPPNSLCFSEN
eukprot:TRINITY_DN868_c0_g1_i1.p1 TRINITY_DN868_c0_g1~~TRINITY_DN868_c0_g1_i1.p1  ORF type:complete len:760 (-),score=170.41 TRINITY_DN868_c0_g1_i1:116-2395(-)